MYGIFTYIWLMFIVNVDKYTIHGSYGNVLDVLVNLKMVAAFLGVLFILGALPI